MKKIFWLSCFLIFCCVKLSAQDVRAVNLKCEYQVFPMGVSVAKPHFSWEVNSQQQGVMQTAYHILVADDVMLLQKGIGNVWDSRKVSSDASIQVAYADKRFLPA